MFDQEAAWAHNQDYFCSFLFKKVLKTDAKLDPDQETAHGLHLMQNKNGRGRTILDLETQLPGPFLPIQLRPYKKSVLNRHLRLCVDLIYVDCRVYSVDCRL